jgi:hypothetical protein
VGGSVTVVPGTMYNAGVLKKWLAGEHYRKVWLTPVNVPVFDISKAKGGLTPVKAGGNMQSLTLHLRAPDGRKYVLRSVQKNPVKTLPQGLQKTFVVDIAQDQVSTMHPYGAIAAAKLAEAIGVLHTDPVIVYVPSSPALGEYRSSHGGMLALFEEKPEGDWANAKNFGYSHNIVSTEVVINNVLQSTNYKVDQLSFARARLLDILIGDWDRSEDQWAWASQTHDSITVYEPIPRDRDQAFVKIDGFFPWMLSRKWAARKYQGFGEEIHDIRGLNQNARWIDRSFLTAVTREQWKNIATDIQTNLTDQVIESTIESLPASPVYADELIRKLKKRRDDLVIYAERYYHVLADEVTITGSKGSELFEVVRMNGDSTRVRVYSCTVSEKMMGQDKEKGEPEHMQLQAEKGKLVYERIFITKETDEIQLFGLEGSDVFEISGETDRGPLVRVIGGDGYDRIADRSKVAGLRKRTKVYDITGRNDFVLGDESRDVTSYDVRVNDYDRDLFNYDEIGPKALIEYNIDDGLYLGGGVQYRHYGFRKKPYSQQHVLVAAASVKTGASYIRYEGDFISLFRKWDFKLDATATPYYAVTYFGLGNETKPPLKEVDSEYNLLRINQLVFRPALKRAPDAHHLFLLGPQYSYVQVRETPGKYITSTEAGLAPGEFVPKHYAGLNVQYRYRNTDNDLVPQQGVVWTTDALWSTQLNRDPEKFSRLGTELSCYIPLPLPLWSTLALRAGGASNFDKFHFWQANYIGGIGIDPGNLRGYRHHRFAGRTSVYQDSELRIKVVSFGGSGDMGVFGFVDQGRVWADNETSGRWHRGWGGGVWITPFNKWVVTGTYAVSEEDKLFNISTGFSF